MRPTEFDQTRVRTVPPDGDVFLVRHSGPGGADASYTVAAGEREAYEEARRAVEAGDPRNGLYVIPGEHLRAYQQHPDSILMRLVELEDEEGGHVTRARPDYDPRVDWPERYMNPDVRSI